MNIEGESKTLNGSMLLSKGKALFSLLYFIIFMLSLYATVTAFLDYSANKTRIYQEKEKHLLAKSQDAAQALDKLIVNIEQHTKNYAKEISQSIERLPQNEINNEVEATAKRLSLGQSECVVNGSSLDCNVIDGKTEALDNNKRKEVAGAKYSMNVYGSAIAFKDIHYRSVDMKDASVYCTSGNCNSLGFDEYSTDNVDTHPQVISAHDIEHSTCPLIQQQALNYQRNDSGYSSNEWYLAPVNNQGFDKGFWSKPYFDPLGMTYMVTYSVPVVDQASCNSSGEQCQTLGVITADITINQLEVISELLVSNSDGFPAITYGDGTYIYHPEKSYVKKNYSLADVAALKCDEDRIIASELAKTRQSQSIAHISKTTQEESWYMVQAMTKSGWSMQNTFYKGTALSEDEVTSLRQQQIHILSSIIVTIIIFLLFVLYMIKFDKRAVWVAATLVSVLLIYAIGVIWSLALHNTKPKNSEDVPVTSTLMIDQIVHDYYQSNLNLVNTKVVPTGIHINTMELKDSHKVNVSGKIWQIIGDKTCSDKKANTSEKQVVQEPDNIYGVQIKNATSIKMVKLDSVINCADKTELLSWNFSADVVYEFDYGRYPLEIEYIDLHLIPKSENMTYIIVPDVDSYKFGSDRKVGLDDDLFVSGWKVFRSYFSLSEPNDSGTTYGSKQDFDNQKFKEYHLKIGLKRTFIDAFISNLTPLIVVAIILFSVTLLPNSIDISRVMGLCVSMFFVVVFSHLAIRRNISPGELFYLEYFFFAIYGLLILVPMDSFRETLGIKSKFFEYQNGLIYKAMYWPLLLISIYIVTVQEFI